MSNMLTGTMESTKNNFASSLSVPKMIGKGPIITTHTPLKVPLFLAEVDIIKTAATSAMEKPTMIRSMPKANSSS